MKQTWRARIGAVTVVMLLVAGCGGDDEGGNGGNGAATLDTAQLEQSLADSIGGGVGGGAAGGVGGGPAFEDVQVDCPDDVEQRSGVSFECSVMAVAGGSAPSPGDPATGTVRVTQSDDSGTMFETETQIEGGGTTQESTGSVSISGG